MRYTAVARDISPGSGLGWLRRAALVLLVLAAAAPRVPAQQEAELPASVLAVRSGEEWRRWWTGTAAPTRWRNAHPVVARAVHWEKLAPGLERGELHVSGAIAGLRFRLLVVRLDPARFKFRLRQATRDAGLRAAWTLDSASADALLAFNAGQFEGGVPWGWLVSGGRELQVPGKGPLSTVVVLAGNGPFQLRPVSDLPALRAPGAVLEAFQSYPTLLENDGEVPAALRAPGRGVDVEHRDARLALGTLADGRLLVVITRFAGLGEVMSSLPVGPTTPEMAAIMGALGCRRAVMLDGGLSSQLLLRHQHGMTELWPGLRRVPLALEAVPIR